VIVSHAALEPTRDRAHAWIVVERSHRDQSQIATRIDAGMLEPHVRQNTCLKYFASGTVY